MDARMSLQVIFGDDEHTAADGPYTRVMKTRKWLYLAASLVLLVIGGWYDPASVTSLIGGVVDVEDALVTTPLIVGLVYLTLQYGLLVTQLLVSYDIVLKDRLTFRRQEDLATARERALAARKEASQVFADIAARMKETNADLVHEVEQARRHSKFTSAMNPANTAARKERESEIRRAEARLVAAENAIAQHRLSNFDLTANPEFKAAQENAQQMERALEEIAKENPALRRGYRWMERSVDALRVFPPLFVALFALWRSIEWTF